MLFGPAAIYDTHAAGLQFMPRMLPGAELDA
jgi:hypothetical protein